MAYKIVVDSGHGGEDPGAVYQGRQEKDDNLRLALEVGRLLEAGSQDWCIREPQMSIRHRLKKHRLPTGKKPIILFRSTEIPVRDRISTRAWRR